MKGVYGKTWVIFCNKQHYFNFTEKIAFNLEMVFAAYNAGLRKQIFEIFGNANAIVLFGSYRKGDDNEKSDVDIAVEVSDNLGLRIMKMGAIPQLGYRKEVPVNLHICSRNIIDINLFSKI